MSADAVEFGPLTITPMPGVILTVEGRVDDETLAVAVCAHLLERLVAPERVVTYLAARLGIGS